MSELKDKRILFILGDCTLGGAERQALNLARQLVQQGAQVEAWGYEEAGRVRELFEEHGITWRFAPIPLPWSTSRLEQAWRLLKFARVLRRARPDVVLPFMFFQSVVCGIVWKLSGARVCIWNQRCEGRDRLGRRAEKLAIRFTPYFVANSEHGAEFMTTKLGINRELIKVVYNGVDPPKPLSDRKTWRSNLGIDDQSFVACMVANLQPFKDHVTLLKAWRIVVDRLAAENRDAVLLLAGVFSGTDLQLKSLAFDLNLGKHVRFLGGVKDVSGLLTSVDIGVHSSVNEGVPNGVLECMAAGLAVAGTDYPGISEALGAEGAAFLAPPFDAEALADRITTLALNPEVRRRAAEANRLRIQNEFNVPDMVEKMCSLIRDGLTKTRPLNRTHRGALGYREAS